MTIQDPMQPETITQMHRDELFSVAAEAGFGLMDLRHKRQRPSDDWCATFTKAVSLCRLVQKGYELSEKRENPIRIEDMPTWRAFQDIVPTSHAGLEICAEKLSIQAVTAEATLEQILGSRPVGEEQLAACQDFFLKITLAGAYD